MNGRGSTLQSNPLQSSRMSFAVFVYGTEDRSDNTGLIISRLPEADVSSPLTRPERGNPKLATFAVNVFCLDSRAISSPERQAIKSFGWPRDENWPIHHRPSRPIFFRRYSPATCQASTGLRELYCPSDTSYRHHSRPGSLLDNSSGYNGSHPARKSHYQPIRVWGGWQEMLSTRLPP
jgi:hypothetical protein